ncbi:MAG: hypothetical protein II671_06885, partial [Salinivirgaceae bacterium]|nr:hypothetical protein [Salinivirgaceae bacterium]
RGTPQNKRCIISRLTAKFSFKFFPLSEQIAIDRKQIPKWKKRQLPTKGTAKIPPIGRPKDWESEL